LVDKLKLAEDQLLAVQQSVDKQQLVDIQRLVDKERAHLHVFELYIKNAMENELCWWN
jgi:hypothetical protein